MAKLRQETEFELDGGSFIAEDSPDNSCTGCYFKENQRHNRCVSTPYCSGIGRADNRNVIWKLKESHE